MNFEGPPQIKKEENKLEPIETVETPELPQHQESKNMAKEAQEVLASADKGIINKISTFPKNAPVHCGLKTISRYSRANYGKCKTVRTRRFLRSSSMGN